MKRGLSISQRAAIAVPCPVCGGPTQWSSGYGNAYYACVRPDCTGSVDETVVLFGEEEVAEGASG